MQSYSSPGRVITVQNSGPGAVEVRRDQPYRLRGLVGVTQHSAKVGAALNLCVEGTYDQFVTLPAGAQPVESGEAVLMHVGTFVLTAGIPADDDHIQFGLLGERLVATGLASVKLMPGAGAAAASGGGGGTDPAITKRVGDVEQAVIALGQSVEATSGAVSGFDGRLDQAEADIDALQAGGGGGGSAAEVTVLDIDSSTNQVTFDVLHPVDLAGSQRQRRGAIRFNRHVYSSGAELMSMTSDGWLTVAKSGLYEIELALYLLDQTLNPAMVGFLVEELQMREEVNTSTPDGLRGTPAITSSGGSYAAIKEYLDACAASGQGSASGCYRADAIWFNGSTAPYVDRRVRWRWRAFLRAGVAVRIFGTVETAAFYVVPQFAYGGLNNEPSNAGTPDARFANTYGPRLVIARIA